MIRLTVCWSWNNIEAEELETCPVSPPSPPTRIQDPGTKETSEAAAEQVKTKAQLWIRKLKPTSFGSSVAEKTEADRRVGRQPQLKSHTFRLRPLFPCIVPRDGPCTFYRLAPNPSTGRFCARLIRSKMTQEADRSRRAPIQVASHTQTNVLRRD